MSGGSLLTTTPATTELGQVVRTAGPVATIPGSLGVAVAAAVTRVAASALNVTLLVANTARRGATIYNNSATQDLFIKYGLIAAIGAGIESFTLRMQPLSYHVVDGGYNGQIDGIWAAADAAGEALMTEMT